jgi:hypothetical protein
MFFVGCRAGEQRLPAWNGVRNGVPKMAASLLRAASTSFPFHSGRLSVSGATARGSAATDGFDVVVDDTGEVCVFVVKVRAPSAPPAGLAAGALAVAKVALESRLPMYELVAEVRRFGASEQDAKIGLSLLRFSPRDSRVEILIAGMPPIVRLLPGADTTLYPALSGAIGARFGEVHPYELSPLVWGSAWILTSDGITGGSRDPAVLVQRVAGSEVEHRAFDLALEPSFALERLVTDLAGEEAAAMDRTLVVVHADPSRRQESGIEPNS